jgi:hypothetical protein
MMELYWMICFVNRVTLSVYWASREDNDEIRDDGDQPSGWRCNGDKTSSFDITGSHCRLQRVAANTFSQSMGRAGRGCAERSVPICAGLGCAPGLPGEQEQRARGQLAEHTWSTRGAHVVNSWSTRGQLAEHTWCASLPVPPECSQAGVGRGPAPLWLPPGAGPGQTI